MKKSAHNRTITWIWKEKEKKNNQPFFFFQMRNIYVYNKRKGHYTWWISNQVEMFSRELSYESIALCAFLLLFWTNKCIFFSCCCCFCYCSPSTLSLFYSLHRCTSNYVSSPRLQNFQTKPHSPIKLFHCLDA